MIIDLSEPEFYNNRRGYGTTPSRYREKKGKGKYFENKLCSCCSATENLTRHHLKNIKGNKTGMTQILCRKCHNQAEREYERLGIIKNQVPVKLTDNEQLQLDYINGLLPFYSLGKPDRFGL